MDALLDYGIAVVFASDNVRDAWSPYGKADMLERVSLAGYLLGWNEDPQMRRGLACVSETPARLLGDEPALLCPGDPADLTLVPAATVLDAITRQPAGRLVFNAGTLVAGAGSAPLAAV